MTPNPNLLTDGSLPGRWWHRESERIVCDLCPRACSLKKGDRGFCFVRENRDGQMVLSTYGKSTGFCIDAIEKKPLNHFYPGTSILSFGTAGCNLGCKFCQNWDISKSREVARLSELATPDQIAAAAADLGCDSVAYTYNDPIIWAEYAMDSAQACRDRGIKSVAVTAGYITEQARGDFFSQMDAANVDLKAFTEEFYHKVTYSHLKPVLDTLRYLKHETDCWFEITNLIIPDANDAPGELRKMCAWIVEKLGVDVPVHFTAFHPDFRMNDRERTSPETLIAAYDIAVDEGLEYVYLGNIHDVRRQSTYCPACDVVLIERDWHQLGQYNMNMNACQACGFQVAGRFKKTPGDWGRRRQSVPMQQYHTPPKVIQISTPTKDAANMTALSLTEPQQQQLLSATNAQVVAQVTNQLVPPVAEALGEIACQPVDGIFVTLKRGDHLRACCGLLGQTLPLSEALAHASARTAKEDHRLPPISPIELPFLRLDVTVLGPPSAMTARGEQRADVIEIGRHGLRIRHGQHQGLLLPSVATENGWNARQFLDAVCRKAGLPSGSWLQDAVALETFEGLMVEGHVQSPRYTPYPVIKAQEIGPLVELAATNINAMIQGAVPMYVAPGVADGTVHGLVLSAQVNEGGATLHWLNFSIRPGVPLQSTLFKLCETAATTLGRQGLSPSKIDLAVLWDPALHGYIRDHDLDGVDTQGRCIVLMDNKRAAVAYQQGAGSADLVQQAASMESFETSGVYSFQIASSASTLAASTGPRASTGLDVRPPAVAGSFYPGDDAQLDETIDAFLPREPKSRQPVRAAMIPHAGLRFSGQVAADVLSQIEIPRDVIIIGPKHTPHGVDWAVAPNASWQLTATKVVQGNRQLAEEIARRVPGMQLDAAAHAKEHAIEVELPLLARIAPESRVTGIAIHGGSMEQLQSAATALADLLASLNPEPLLLISSDMNHFADDTETRRRDRLALDALASLDAQELLATCRDHDISMCGQLPAALVLQVLHAQGREFSATEIAYRTSADVTGDTSRVVGYAGVLLA